LKARADLIASAVASALRAEHRRWTTMVDFDMDHFHIRPIAEEDIEKIVLRAGGGRAHPDADRRRKPGADFVLGDVVIELKSLDEDGFEKPERQRKLAALFRQREPDRQVIVIDRGRLSTEGQMLYDRALEGPIKTAIASARGQLRQSREELTNTKLSVLFFVNNGYTALNHEELMALAARRVRNDSSEIDGVIVGGCYFYSDTFDSYFLWPLDYIPIRIDRAFQAFDQLKTAWDELANEIMTKLVIHGHGAAAVKGPVVDTQFEIDEVTYVKPTPPIGRQSDFFLHGRPRKNSSGLTHCPPVGLTFPNLSAAEWGRFRATLANAPELLGSYDEWCSRQRKVADAGTAMMPFIAIPVTVDGWMAWRASKKEALSFTSVKAYANDLFEAKLRVLFAAARQRTPQSILPERYMLATTEEIGQDQANDVSGIALVQELINGETAIRPVLENARLFHEYALTLACAYAVAHSVNAVLWQKDQTYGWA
jgi:hypothetical protein